MYNRIDHPPYEITIDFYIHKINQVSKEFLSNKKTFVNSC